MALPAFDLVRENYELGNPFEVVRLQGTVEDFMEAVRSNKFEGAEGMQLMDDFCAFVSIKRVWNLAEKVVPEFRLDPELLPEGGGGVPGTCLRYVLRRSKIPLLPAPPPPPPPEKRVITPEDMMLLDRHKKYQESLATGGQGKHSDSDSDRTETDHLGEHVKDPEALVRQGEGLPGQEGAKQSEENKQDMA